MNLQISPQAAAKELLTRRKLRKSLTDWCIYKGFNPALHHQLIIDELEDFVVNPDLDVLVFGAPPGSAKTTYISVLFPSWLMANYPQSNVLFATHSAEFAERWGRRVRNDINEDSLTLGIKVAADNAAAARWALEEGGEYYGVGAGVGISGFRSNWGIVDDLFGSREDAWSETIRRKRWDWFNDDFSARLKPGGKRVLMNTRWHAEDVSGKVIDQIERGIIRGKVIMLRAKAREDDPLGRKVGEYLWDEPGKYNYGAYLRERERESTPMMWSALYQQDPTPEDGEYFKREWLKPYDKLPDRTTMRVYGGSDYAVTADGGDYTVHIVVGVDPEGRMYLLDLWRQQAASDVWIEAFCDMVLKWKPIEWAEETGQIKASLGPFIDRRQRERKAYVKRTQFPTRGDKSIRAQSIRGRMALESLFVNQQASYFPDFRSELLSFPAGKHDDQVDALGLIGQLLDTITHGQPLAKQAKPDPLDDYKEIDPDDDDDDWKAL